MKNFPGQTEILLLGVTGGIASGKSTVACMLEEMGAPMIDFDVLAREVVAPGKPAWKEIVDYFGNGVLQKDRSLNRAQLRDEVFQNPEKRKKLESMTHPRILDLYLTRVKEFRSASTPILQAVIPLLFEANLQKLVHKILVVYIPWEMQRERLMKRDHISRAEAERILSAQMPLDEKMARADFVIHNEKGLEKTRKQVENIMHSLKTKLAVRIKNG